MGAALDFNMRNHRVVSDNTVYLEWASAFITALSFINADIKDNIIQDTPSLDLWLRNWCTSHPTDQFSTAATMFLRTETGKK